MNEVDKAKEPQIFTWAKNSWTWSTFHFFISSLLGSFMLIMITSISSDHIKLVTVTAVLQCCSAAGVHCMQCLHNICNLVSWRRSSPNNIGPCPAQPRPLLRLTHTRPMPSTGTQGEIISQLLKERDSGKSFIWPFFKKLYFSFNFEQSGGSLGSKNGFQ